MSLMNDSERLDALTTAQSHLTEAYALIGSVFCSAESENVEWSGISEAEDAVRDAVKHVREAKVEIRKLVTEAAAQS